MNYTVFVFLGLAYFTFHILVPYISKFFFQNKYSLSIFDYYTVSSYKCIRYAEFLYKSPCVYHLDNHYQPFFKSNNLFEYTKNGGTLVHKLSLLHDFGKNGSHLCLCGKDGCDHVCYLMQFANKILPNTCL